MGRAETRWTGCLAVINSIGLATLLLPLAAINAAPKAPLCTDCNVILENQQLIIENSVFSRRYDWNNGNIISRTITNKLNASNWKLSAALPDFAFPVDGLSPQNARLDVVVDEGDNIVPRHLKITIDFDINLLTVRRSCRLFADVAALQCEFLFKGTLPDSLAHWMENRHITSINDRNMIENPHEKKAQNHHVVMERLSLPGKHWQLRVISFDVATDYNDTLTQDVRVLAFRKDLTLKGNLLTIENSLTGDQFFILKESPSKADQLYYPGYDFIVNQHDIRVVGLGVDRDDIKSDQWVRSHGVVTGLSEAGELSLLTAIRHYQHHTRRWIAKRDSMILMNTWGDRSRDGRVSDAFITRELKAAARLGITHFQIDDGWQAGLSSNSASSTGSLWSNWRGQDWQPHPTRFPNGLAPLTDTAVAMGIELGIWFNPSSHNDYAQWQRDADILLNLYRRHKIRVFKIDGIDIQSKKGEDNLRKFFDRVQHQSNGNVVFNLDVTAGRRPGYHHMIEYGNIFLENRYTDWANYYPYRTLRNLWMLSFYVPPQRLQIEFLNKWRNQEKYDSDDPLAPFHIPFDYLFAITMFAQPLAWFEATGLPAKALSVAPTIKRYQQLQAAIHAGMIFPIGDEPDGTAWTGFQSLSYDNSNNGYILVFREFNAESSFDLKTWLPARANVHFTRVLGQGENFVAQVGQSGHVRFSLPAAHSFSLYRYQISAAKE